MTQIPSKSAGTPKPQSGSAAPGWSDTRLLLRRLRDLVAMPGQPQERLNRIVSLIANNMVAEVCSIYLRRAGDVLELFATHGLNPEAVHNTRLRIGEGIIGDIAARALPMALSDAQKHPNFAYRPETGEEIYQSMMGVPILHAGRVYGVLAVQNRTRRHYHDDEVEALQTIAMVAAEMVASGEFVPASEIRPVDGIGVLPLRADGIRINSGAAMGTAVLHEPVIVVPEIIADDIELETARLETAFKSMHSALDDMLADSALAHRGEHRDILETYRMIAEDRGWTTRIREAIAGGLSAEAAVQKVRNETRARMARITDSYLRERLSDLEDLANRLMNHLAGDGGSRAQAELPDDMVLVAHNMGPAELLDYDREKLRAIVLEEGSPTSHVAIIARELDIPIVGRVADAMDRIELNDLVVVDGDNAQVFIRPGEEVQEAFRETFELRERQREYYAATRDQPAVTKDGTQVSLLLNAGLLVDIPSLHQTGADGVGLYRTEIPFMARSSFPEVGEQTALYKRILEQAKGKPVVFRTLDVGGDKVLPYFDAQPDENPAMGWRALRIALDRPAILRQQLRALATAASGRELHVMFPMVSEVAEFETARKLLDRELARLADKSVEHPSTVKVGAMLEVPALAWQIEQLVSRADFVSVGSNDLLQFLFASDRGNPRLSHRYDSLSPSVLNLLRSVVRACDRAEIPVTLCGEMAGEPLEAIALIGLGFRRLSMSAASIGPVKEAVRALDLERLTEYMATLAASTDHSLRQKLKGFARDHGIPV